MTCKRTGKYSCSIQCRLRDVDVDLSADRLTCPGGDLTVLRSDRFHQGRRQPFVLLAILFDRTARDQVLQLLISAQAKHFLTATGSVSSPKVFVDDIEKFLELERGASGKDCHQLLGHKIRNSARKCVFLENSHRARKIAHVCRADSIIL